MQKTVGIHQPNLLPWLGYFSKITQSDVFVLLDTVDFQTGNANSITNRTRIKTQQGELWLTVPVKKSTEKTIDKICIDHKQPWVKKHLKTIQMAYGKAPYFEPTFEWLSKRLTQEEHVSISALNSLLILDVKELLQLTTPVIKSSELAIAVEDKNERIIAICKSLDATCYLSGNGARSYNDEPAFNQQGIELKYTSFQAPVYPQLHGPFLPGLSILDVLMNCSIPTIQKILLPV
jgi:WbqC-like protein family